MSDKPKIAIGIPTCPRASEHSYLHRTLESLARAIPEADRGRVRVLVMDASPSGREHAALHSCVEVPPLPFTVVSRQAPEVTLAEVYARAQPASLDGEDIHRIRWRCQLSRDFLDLLRAAAATGARLLVRLEDDTRVVERFPSRLRKVVARHADVPFLSLFSSRPRLDGMTTLYHDSGVSGVGLVFQAGAALDPILAYVDDHVFRAPFDVALGWYRDGTGRGGRVVYPSLVQHVGTANSFDGRDRAGDPEFHSPTFRGHRGVFIDVWSQIGIAAEWLRRGWRARSCASGS